MLDPNGYPTEETLEKIRTWSDNWESLLDLCKEIWHYPEFFHKFEYEKAILYSTATGGWSGNEDIICALQENLPFWEDCWQAGKRGGIFEFEVKKG